MNLFNDRPEKSQAQAQTSNFKDKGLSSSSKKAVTGVAKKVKEPVRQEPVDLKSHRILVANRGEIAMRIMRACQKLGVGFTAVYTAEDEASGHVALARELGDDKALFRVSSYHDANELMAVADEARCTAVHPGSRQRQQKRRILSDGPD